jgi:hypothetical protein
MTAKLIRISVDETAAYQMRSKGAPNQSTMLLLSHESTGLCGVTPP